ncbi:8589_t:CDS:2 [Scutellospora calospora]|uniref:8589_t:CDS:1 n=1 Tax=Scutellospora calospora TaxID=85575 RepID=A0ACA9KA70_9GLOM|nr:8589_t:CDS:2 [Scutellospora calospora]
MNIISTDGSESQTQGKTITPTPIGPSLGMNPVQVTECTYETTFWPRISDFVQNALQANLQIERPLHTYSHEELYRSIYWMCWQGFQKRLYSDLISVIEETLEKLGKQLESNKQLNAWFTNFQQICVNHAKATDILGSVFAYLVFGVFLYDNSDKTYIQYTLRENLRDVLVDRFQLYITEKSEMRIIYTFDLVLDNPRLLELNAVKDVVKAMYKISPDNIYLNPTLFQNLIEDIKMPSNFEDIQVRHTTLETKYQLEKLKIEGWESGHSSQQKRSLTLMNEGDENQEEPLAKRRQC